MSRLRMVLLLAATSIAVPAAAQSGGYSNANGDANDRTDHYNHQRSIVPDTVPDEVRHDREQVRSDRNDIRRDTNQLIDDRIQAREANQSYRENLRTGNTSAAATDAAAIEANRQERLQHQRAYDFDDAALRDDKQDLRESTQAAKNSTVPATQGQGSHLYNGQTGTVKYGAQHHGR